MESVVQTLTIVGFVQIVISLGFSILGAFHHNRASEDYIEDGIRAFVASGIAIAAGFSAILLLVAAMLVNSKV